MWVDLLQPRVVLPARLFAIEPREVILQPRVAKVPLWRRLSGSPVTEYPVTKTRNGSSSSSARASQTTAVRPAASPMHPLLCRGAPSDEGRSQALLERYPGVFTLPRVAPGVNGFISYLLDIRLFQKDRRLVLTTPSAGSLRGGSDPPLATVTLAELHVVNLVAPPSTLDHVYHPATPFATERVRYSAALLLLQLRVILAALPVVNTH